MAGCPPRATPASRSRSRPSRGCGRCSALTPTTACIRASCARAFAALEAAPPEVGLALSRHRRDRPAAELHHRRRVLAAHAAGRELLRRRQPDAARARGPRPAFRRADARRLRGLGFLVAGRGPRLCRAAPAGRGLPVPPPPGEHVVGGGASAACAAARPACEARAPLAPAAPARAGGRGGAALCAILAGAAGHAPGARPGARARRAPRTRSRARAVAGSARSPWKRSTCRRCWSSPPTRRWICCARTAWSATCSGSPRRGYATWKS